MDLWLGTAVGGRPHLIPFPPPARTASYVAVTVAPGGGPGTLRGSMKITPSALALGDGDLPALDLFHGRPKVLWNLDGTLARLYEDSDNLG